MTTTNKHIVPTTTINISDMEIDDTTYNDDMASILQGVRTAKEVIADQVVDVALHLQAEWEARKEDFVTKPYRTIDPTDHMNRMVQAYNGGSGTHNTAAVEQAVANRQAASAIWHRDFADNRSLDMEEAVTDAMDRQADMYRELDWELATQYDEDYQVDPNALTWDSVDFAYDAQTADMTSLDYMSTEDLITVVDHADELYPTDYAALLRWKAEWLIAERTKADYYIALAKKNRNADELDPRDYAWASKDWKSITYHTRMTEDCKADLYFSWPRNVMLHFELCDTIANLKPELLKFADKQIDKRVQKLKDAETDFWAKVEETEAYIEDDSEYIPSDEVTWGEWEVA